MQYVVLHDMQKIITRISKIEKKNTQKIRRFLFRFLLCISYTRSITIDLNSDAHLVISYFVNSASARPNDWWAESERVISKRPKPCSNNIRMMTMCRIIGLSNSMISMNGFVYIMYYFYAKNGKNLIAVGTNSPQQRRG